MALHSGGSIDSVAQQAVLLLASANHRGNHRPTVQPNAYLHRTLGGVRLLHRRVVRGFHCGQSKQRQSGSVVLLLFYEVCACDESIPNGLHLEDVHLSRDSIKLGVQAVQHVRHRRRVHHIRQVREAHNIAEENRHALLLLRIDLLACDELLRHVLREDVEKHVIGGLPPREVQNCDLLAKVRKGRPQVRVLRPAGVHELGNQGRAVRRDEGPVRLFPLTRLRADSEHGVVGVFFLKRHPARKELPDRDPEGVDITAHVAIAPQEHLWRSPWGEGLLDPGHVLEIEAVSAYLGTELSVHQDVVRLQVPVHDVGGVQVGHPAGDIPKD
mmetsp:Transcript_49357/g.120421  ORF Transcript_49357/g.120421 Transcript_49357/m.120421 type:complete len:327 (+) Transcript_49357:943-1923(+)